MAPAKNAKTTICIVNLEICI